MASEDEAGTTMITLNINDTPFDIDERDLALAFAALVPDFLKNASIAAPDDMSDLIRGGMKSTFALVGNKMLFQIYGAHAPVIPKKADKLPYMWGAMSDWLIMQLLSRDIRMQAIETDPGRYRIVGITAPSRTGASHRPTQEEAGTTT